jgi:glycosyltransferase involved in cell wall biosynthesis
MQRHNPTDPVQPICRVLHIASGDLWAGAEVALFHLACELSARADMRVEVALLNDGDLATRLRDAGVTVHIIDEQQHGLIALLMRLIFVTRGFRPHIVHTHRNKEHLLGTLAAALVPGCISLRTVHGSAESILGLEPGLRDLIKQKLDRIISNLQRCTIAVSAPLATELRACQPGTRIHTIVNGIDYKAIQAAATQPCGIPHSDRIGICFSGRLVTVKRIDIFLAAARTILDEHPGRYVFYVIGDGPLRVPLEAQAQQLQLGSDCVFTGFLPNALPVLSRMRALVLTSDHEGTPMIALEALALGVPVVAHAVGGLVPLLGSATQGRLVRSQDPTEVARGIIATVTTCYQPNTA